MRKDILRYFKISDISSVLVKNETKIKALRTKILTFKLSFV